MHPVTILRTKLRPSELRTKLRSSDKLRSKLWPPIAELGSLPIGDDGCTSATVWNKLDTSAGDEVEGEDCKKEIFHENKRWVELF